MRRFGWVLAGLLSTGMAAQGVTRYVSAASTNPVPPYTNWNTAALSIFSALFISTDGDVILVTNGWYSVTLTVTNAVTITSVNGQSATIANCVYLRGFFLQNTGAVVSGFTVINGRADHGGGAYVEAGVLRDCLFMNCMATNGSGGGVFVREAGRVENCIISNCWAAHGGGGLYNDGGTVEGLSLFNNTAESSGGGLYSSGGYLRNVLAWGNRSMYVAANGGGLFLGRATAECCTVVGNSAGYGGGVYNSGGCLRNSIIIGNSAALGPPNYNASAWGTNIIEYCCLPETPGGTGNITNDPMFVSYSGGNFRLSTNSPCREAGTNAAWMAGATDLDGNVRLIRDRVDMGAYEFQIAHVAPGGGHVPPFDTWSKAATNIHAAVNVISNHYMVLVTNGTYRAGAPLVISKPIYVCSVNGRDATAIDGAGTTRCILIDTNAHGAVLDGFTVTNGYSDDTYSGAGIYCAATATIANCTIANNRGAGYGGGVYAAGGVLRNCDIRNNSSFWGGGVFFKDSGALFDCVVQCNTSTYGGGGVQCWLGNGQIRNCLVVNNTATLEGAGGIDIYNGVWGVENCTVCDNHAPAGYPGGVLGSASPMSSVTNCIIMFNTPSNYATLALSYCCASPLAAGPGNISTDPLFANRPAGRYQLTTNSPCRNAGTNAAWMAAGRDLQGVPRVVESVVDMGAYELTPIHYVAPGGAHVWPFVSWADAATNVQAAVDAADAYETVLVSNGVFSPGAEIVLTQVLTVASVNGATATAVNGGGTHRCFTVYTSATIRGFTLTNGFSATVGGGAYLAGGGMLESCVVQRCWATEAAGGVYVLSNGTLLACRLIANTTTYYNAGAVYLRRGGALAHCVIASNAAASAGAVYCEQGGALTNCLIYGNRARSGYGGGIVFDNGGWAESCTIADNVAATNGGGVWVSGGGVLLNSIIYDNAAASGSNVFINLAGASFTNCCTAPALGTACVSNDPQFVSVAARNFRLQLESPCREAGMNRGWMAAGTDLDGSPRISGTAPDIGAYEFHWTYVATNGASVPPYDTWAKAATDLQAAILVAASNGYPVLVTNGFYAPSSTLTLNSPIRVCSVNGASATTLSGSGVRRVFYAVTNAIIEGFTITNGYAADLGGGLYLDYGAVLRSSRVVGCRSAMFAGGINARRGARVEDCEIANNQANNNMGGGVYLSEGAMLERCVVVSNVAPYGGGLCDQGGTTRNCLILHNLANFGGGVYLRGSTYGVLESSSVCHNQANSGGGVYDEGGGTVRNCIVYFNSISNHVVTGATWQHNNTTPSVGTACITNDPLFVGVGDYHLTFASPCRNAGTNQTWMADGSDYDRGPRIVGPAVDLGADELGFLHFVRLLGSWTPAPPYDSWDTAATNIQDALNVCIAGDMVVVTDGVYVAAAEISVTQSVWLTSVNGASNTTINGQGVRRCLGVWTSAVVSGFTFSNGYASHGGGVYLAGGGRVQDSVFVTNRAGQYGGGAFIAGTGVIANCRFVGNAAMTNDAGAVYFQRGGMVLNCEVVSNLAMKGGGFFFESDGLARNCLVRHNRARGTWGGGALFYGGGMLENCTVCDNSALEGGGVYGGPAGTSVVKNTILYFNTSTSGSGSNYFGMTASNIIRSCTAPALGTGCVSANPVFAQREAGNYRLSWFSPCVNAGAWNDWMNGASDLDGDARVWNEAVDIGAYELPIFFVATNGSHVAPFASWSTAATNPVAVASVVRRHSLVWIGPGTYTVSREIRLTGSVAFVSTGGATATTIRGNGSTRCLYLGKGSCLAQGLTIENGYTNGDGGGVYVDSGGTLRDSIIRSNSADMGGGIFCFASGVVDRCVLTANQAPGGYGGAVHLLAGGLVQNCLVYSNTAAHGGGIYLGYGTGMVRNCTVVRNTAEDSGGGIECGPQSRVENTIAWFNTAPSGSNHYESGSNIAYSNCCTAPAIGTACVEADPLFANLTGCDFRIGTNSPCVDAGLDALSVTNDLDRMMRPLDGNRDGVAAWDIGAYECVNSLADTDGNGMPDGWEYAYFGWPVSGADPFADPDDDGFLNREEAVADTHPYDDLSYLTITNIVNDGEWRTIQFHSSAQRVYTMEWSSNAMTWLVGSYERQLGNDGTRSWKATNDIHALYRVRVEIP